MQALLSSSKLLLVVALAAALGWSFWHSAAWLTLCAGLAFFLFGMQTLEQGLKQMAGTRMEAWLARGTGTPLRGLFFGMAATFVLQSSTLVSLLTIAFLSTGLVTLVGAIAVLLGANLGATSGIWLLALAGHGLSLSPVALPLFVFGMLLSFAGERAKGAGRLLLGVALIFLGIDQIKEGFSAFGDLRLDAWQADGWRGTALFVAVGALVTVVLQSSHATLMLTLAALAGQQLVLDQAVGIAIGSNVGSAASTALMGFIGSRRSGQRLAIAHVVFNASTALVTFLAVQPLTWFVLWATGLVGQGANALIQLALFHTLFNAVGVLLFWPWQPQFAAALQRWLPDVPEPPVLTQAAPVVHARYLNRRALLTVESALQAVSDELQHLARLSHEVVARTLYCPPEQWEAPLRDDPGLRARAAQQGDDGEALYQAHVKGVYAELVDFMGRMELPLDAVHHEAWFRLQAAAVRLVDGVRAAQRLQHGLLRHLPAREGDAAREACLDLRHEVLRVLAQMRLAPGPAMAREGLNARWKAFEEALRERILADVRSNVMDGMSASSLISDLRAAEGLLEGFRQVGDVPAAGVVTA